MNFGKYYNIAESDQEAIQKLEWVKYVAFAVSAETRQITYTIFPKNGDKFDFVVHFDVPIPSEQIALEIDRRYKADDKTS